jgi:hypothetical protein
VSENFLSIISNEATYQLMFVDVIFKENKYKESENKIEPIGTR